MKGGVSDGVRKDWRDTRSGSSNFCTGMAKSSEVEAFLDLETSRVSLNGPV